MSMIDEATCTAFIVKELSDITGNESITADHSFRDAGGDSIRAILLASAIEEEYEITIDIVEVYEADSLRDLGLVVASCVAAPQDRAQ